MHRVKARRKQQDCNIGAISAKPSVEESGAKEIPITARLLPGRTVC